MALYSARCAVCHRNQRESPRREPIYCMAAVLVELGYGHGQHAHVSCVQRIHRRIQKRLERGLIT